MFEGFAVRWINVDDDVRLRVRVGGDGPPVVLLHGHQPYAHDLARRRAAAGRGRHTVVCPDLRGYGRSSAPPVRTDHAQASKRALAADVLELMHERFAVVGHDRGSYVAFRLAMDHPEAVDRLAVLDSVPIGEALARADARFAAAWWHWFFFAQPGIPERVITADPDAWYGTGPERAASMGEGNYTDYLTAIRDPAVVLAMVEDYRAGLDVDRAADDADRAAGRRLACPALWPGPQPTTWKSSTETSRPSGVRGQATCTGCHHQRPPPGRGSPRPARRGAHRLPRTASPSVTG